MEENVGHIRGLVRDSTLEAYRGVMIFSRAAQMFSEDPRIPANDRRALRVHGDNLIPVGSMEILPGVNSYPMAIKAVISVLDKLMTKEVSAAIHAYAEKIFLPPAQDNAKHGREPFDGTLFKPGE